MSWMDAVLLEFARMTWQDWIVDLSGACGLTVIVACCARPAK
jgi:hypothetical protein